jgi:hypothetical protein
MARWIIDLWEKLKPLEELILEEIKRSDYVSMDETRLRVIKAQKKLSYIWTIYKEKKRPLILYAYRPGRGKEYPVELLKGFQGYLQTDGYAGYNGISGVVRLGCWAHCRRKFYEAWKSGGSKLGGEFIELIGKLYAIEEEIKDLDIGKKFEIRKEKCPKILKKIEDLLRKHENKNPQGSKIATAITYALNQWEYLNVYLQRGDLNIDNNLIENRIRPVAIGRKNWLFCDTESGADATTFFYSLVVNAELNGLIPQNYIHYVISKVPYLKTKEDFMAILPNILDLGIGE